MPAQRHPTTVHLSAPDMVRLVRRKGLSACIAGVAQRIEREFERWNEFDKSARPACHSEVGVIELMPIADASLFAFKYVNGHPSNHRHGLPTAMAFGVLADAHTGAPRLLSKLTLTTVTADKTKATILTPEIIEPGMHINAVGGERAPPGRPRPASRRSDRARPDPRRWSSSPNCAPSR